MQNGDTTSQSVAVRRHKKGYKKTQNNDKETKYYSKIITQRNTTKPLQEGAKLQRDTELLQEMQTKIGYRLNKRSNVTKIDVKKTERKHTSSPGSLVLRWLMTVGPLTCQCSEACCPIMHLSVMAEVTLSVIMLSTNTQPSIQHSGRNQIIISQILFVKVAQSDLPVTWCTDVFEMSFLQWDILKTSYPIVSSRHQRIISFSDIHLV